MLSAQAQLDEDYFLSQVFGNVDGALLTPNVIYAMWQGKVWPDTPLSCNRAVQCFQVSCGCLGVYCRGPQHEDKSNRPFETVVKLAESLGADGS